MAAIETAQCPDDVAAPGRTLLQLVATGEQARDRLTAVARTHPKIATALQLAGRDQEELIGALLGWDVVTSAWCRFYEKGDRWDRWAEQLLIPLMVASHGMSTNARWWLVLRLVESSPSEKVLGIIGAGPLEDLLSSDPEAVAQLIEHEAPGNQRLRLALRDTWQFRTPDDAFAKVKRFAQPDG